MGFGFCIPNNPYDQVAIRLGPVQTKVHHRLRECVSSHWKSETWDPRESVFYLQVASHNTSSHSTGHAALNLNYLRGLPPELARSVYIIMLESSEATGEVGSEKQIWEATICVLLYQMEQRLMEITKWDGKLPRAPVTPRARAALIYRTGQVNIMEEVISDLKSFIGILKEGDVDIKNL